jgi:hypothetical protein
MPEIQDLSDHPPWCSPSAQTHFGVAVGVPAVLAGRRPQDRGLRPIAATRCRRSPRSLVLGSNGGIAGISGKSDTPRLFVKTGTVESAESSQAKESSGIAQAEEFSSSENSLDCCAREARLAQGAWRASAIATGEVEPNPAPARIFVEKRGVRVRLFQW